MSKTLPHPDTLVDLFKPQIPNLRELNLADNELTDEYMVTILELLMTYKALTSLNLSGNFSKSKYAPARFFLLLCLFLFLSLFSGIFLGWQIFCPVAFFSP